MKTFEEALARNYRKVPLEESDRLDQVARDLHDGFDSYTCLAKDAQDSQVLPEIAKVWYSMAITDGVEDAVFAAFMTGLVTGIEMEKAE
jgi:hypothetical protein